MEDVGERGAGRALVFGDAPVRIGDAEAVREVEPVRRVRVGERAVAHRGVAPARQEGEAPRAEARGGLLRPCVHGRVVLAHPAPVGAVAKLLAHRALRVAPVGAGEDRGAAERVDRPVAAVDLLHVEEAGRAAAQARVRADGPVGGKRARLLRDFVLDRPLDVLDAAAQVAGDEEARAPGGNGKLGAVLRDEDAAVELGAGLRVAGDALDAVRRERKREVDGLPPAPFGAALVDGAVHPRLFAAPDAFGHRLDLVAVPGALGVGPLEDREVPVAVEVVEHADAHRGILRIGGPLRRDAGSHDDAAAFRRRRERAARVGGEEGAVRVPPPGDGVEVPGGCGGRGGGNRPRKRKEKRKAEKEECFHVGRGGVGPG